MNKRWFRLLAVCGGGLLLNAAGCYFSFGKTFRLPIALQMILYFWFSMYVVWFTRRWWLIPMLILLPVIVLPGELALVSFSGTASKYLYQSLTPFLADIQFREMYLPYIIFWCMNGALAALFLWGGYRLWQRKYSFKRGMIQFTNIILISLLLWCLALGINTIRASNAVRCAMKKTGPILPVLKDKNGKDGIAITAEFEHLISRLDPDFRPPSSGAFCWLKNKDGAFSEENDKIINTTLAGLNSPDVKELYRKLDALPSQAPFSGGLLFLKEKEFPNGLSLFRRIGRHYLDRARIAHYTGRTKEILPPLEKMIVLDEMLQDSHLIIAELIRCAIYTMRTDAILSLGPTGKEDAPFYRKELEASLKRQYSIPTELDFVTLGVKHSLRHVGKPSEFLFSRGPKLPFPIALFLRPLDLGRGCALIKDARNVEKQIPEFKNTFYKTSADKPFRLLPTLQQTVKGSILQNRLAETIARTGFALKLYRCLHDRYPEKLEQLVPSILKELPLDPYSGKPLIYTLENGDFTLQPRRMPYKASSKPSY